MSLKKKEVYSGEFITFDDFLKLIDIQDDISNGFNNIKRELILSHINYEDFSRYIYTDEIFDKMKCDIPLPKIDVSFEINLKADDFAKIEKDSDYDSDSEFIYHYFIYQGFIIERKGKHFTYHFCIMSLKDVEHPDFYFTRCEGYGCRIYDKKRNIACASCRYLDTSDFPEYDFLSNSNIMTLKDKIVKIYLIKNITTLKSDDPDYLRSICSAIDSSLKNIISESNKLNYLNTIIKNSSVNV